jgi:hypothetical protein
LGEEQALRAEELAAEAARLRGQMIRQIPAWVYVLLSGALIAGVLTLLERRRRKTQDLPLPSWIEKTMDERGLRIPVWLRVWSRHSLRTPMENLFANVAWMLRVWGHKVDPSATPAEQISVLVTTVPGVRSYANTLLEEYQRAMYSPYPANISRAKEAVTQLRSIGYRNWLMRLVGLEN